jgi:hypothetical protein
MGGGVGGQEMHDARDLLPQVWTAQRIRVVGGRKYCSPQRANRVHRHGQDVANISEPHAGIVYAQLTESGDY